MCGANVDGKLLLLWVVAHGESQLKVHGFEPHTSRRMGELVLGSEDWAPMGVGPLAELSSTETRDLCNRVCGMLGLDEEESRLLLRLRQPKAPVEDASAAPTTTIEPEAQDTLLYSCASRLSGRPLLLSFWKDLGAADADEVLVRGVDASSAWSQELRLQRGDYAVFGYGPSSGLTADDLVALCHVVSTHVRVSEEDGTLRLHLMVAPPAAAPPAVEAPEAMPMEELQASVPEPVDVSEPAVKQVQSRQYLERLDSEASTSETPGVAR